VAIWFALTWLIGFLFLLAPSRRLSRPDVFPAAGLAAFVVVGLAYALPPLTQVTRHLSR
jgi:hypothetical protein